MNYSYPNNKTVYELELELREVYNEHYASTSYLVQGYSGPDFEGMVRMMAGDTFYPLHFIAKDYVQFNDTHPELAIW